MCIHIKTENFENSILMQYLYNEYNKYFSIYSYMQIIKNIQDNTEMNES